MNDSPLLPVSISELFAEVSNTGKITLLDQAVLLAAISNDTTPEEEKQAIERILYAIRLGRVQVIEDYV
jgi:hypothetical protein